ncbi:MAG: hypothetical protein KDD70_19075, partial [Bdellovibrionales bacterium]|nr:hypothetical protein [Bdellovibrionales bacterium]
KSESPYDARWKDVVTGLEDLEGRAEAPAPGAADLDALKEHASMLQEVVKHLELCRAALCGSPAPAEYGFAKRSGIDQFSLHLPGPRTEQSRAEYLRLRLQSSPEEAEDLIASLSKIGVDLSKPISGPIEGVLRTDSNRKSLTEQKELYGTGLADPIVGLDFAIEAVLQARANEIDLRSKENEAHGETTERVYMAALNAGLSEGTATLLRLLDGNLIRLEGESGPVSICVHAHDGRLHLSDDYREGNIAYFAIGAAPPAPEGKP